jgi:hypothetical protein
VGGGASPNDAGVASLRGVDEFLRWGGVRPPTTLASLRSAVWKVRIVFTVVVGGLRIVDAKK